MSLGQKIRKTHTKKNTFFLYFLSSIENTVSFYRFVLRKINWVCWMNLHIQQKTRCLLVSVTNPFVQKNRKKDKVGHDKQTKTFFITLNEKTTTTARQMPMKGYMHTLINKKRRRKESVNKQKNYCNNMCMISVSLYMEEEGRERKSVCCLR